MNKTIYDLVLNQDNGYETNTIIQNYFIEDSKEPIAYIPNLNLINIFVGANNSGKSRFMRFLMECKNLIGVQDIVKIREYVKEYNQYLKEFNEKKIFTPRRRYEQSIITTTGFDEERKMLQFLLTNILQELKIGEFFNLKAMIDENETKVTKIKSQVDFDSFFETAHIKINKSLKDFSLFKSYFIPTLRSAHSLFQKNEDSFSKLEKDIYLDTLNRYYNFKENTVNIFTGLHLYKEILNSRNSKRSVRESFEKFEKFISENFFNNKQVDIVAEFNKDESLSGSNNSENISIYIEGEKETRYLYELGDGIQAIIILMYKIFMAESESFIFIDEPEINLHPGMQRLFLDQISGNKYLKGKNLTYFISTHSNHLLDITLDKQNISIYSFSSDSAEGEDKKFYIRNVNAGDNSILKNLGVNNSSVFLANCSIWVEGISDRNYLKAFLNSYMESLGKEAPKLREDLDFAFFEYAGSNIDHYLFEQPNFEDSGEKIINDIKSLALSNKIFLLADSDVASKSSKKGKKLKELEALNRPNFQPHIIWDVREIENLLTIEIWEEILITLCNKDLVKKNKTEIQSKITDFLNNVKIADYKKEYIGRFLNDVSQKLGKIGSKNILNESSYISSTRGALGTLTNKRELSELVLELKFPWDKLKRSKEIKTLTEKLYNFIISSKNV